MDDDALAARLAPLFQPREVILPSDLRRRVASRHRRHRVVGAAVAGGAIGLGALIGALSGGGLHHEGAIGASGGAGSRPLPSGDIVRVGKARDRTIGIDVGGIHVLAPPGLGLWAYPANFPVRRSGEQLAVTGALITWTGTKGIAVVTAVPGPGVALVQARVGDQHDRVVAQTGRVAVLVIEVATFQPGWPSPTGSVTVEALDATGHVLGSVVGVMGSQCPPPGFNLGVAPAVRPAATTANRVPPVDLNALLETTRCPR